MIPHDVPTAQQLVESVREWLERDVLTETTGRLQFHTRVAINVLAMVERELELGPEQAERHLARLAELGVGSDEALAAAIRSGAIGESPEEAAQVRDVVWASVRDKLMVAHPSYVDDGPG